MPDSLQKILLLVDGAAGTGKSDLLSLLRRRYRQPGSVGVIRKVTTRSERQEEAQGKIDLELDFISELEFSRLVATEGFYQYEYGGNHYGLPRPAIIKSIGENQISIAIVRNSAVLQNLKEDFRHIARVIVLFIYTDQTLVPERLKKEGFSEEYIAIRLGRGQIAWDDYLRHPGLYDRILLNNSSRNDLERLAEGLLRDLIGEPADQLCCDATGELIHLPPSLVGHKKAMLLKLAKNPYNKNVFLMMKFRESNREIGEFIRAGVGGHGFNCVRADDAEWNITGDVYNPVAVLCCCKYGIALFDEPEPDNLYSPNVAYELGMMHNQRKRCLILRHSRLPEPPFDLISQLHSVYSRDLELYSAVSRWLGELRGSI